MKHLVVALLLALSSSAFADEVNIAGKRYSTGLLPRPKDAPRTYFAPAKVPMEGLPEAYDSRDAGLIPAIRNQGNCGSCWAFATTGAFETALIKAGKATSDINLAEQDPLVNDSSAYGCQGGFMDGTFLTNKGETTEALCPYRASTRYSCRGEKFAKATKWALLGASNRAPTVDELREGIFTYGSLFVTVAAGSGFSPRNGEIRTCGSPAINHMVQLVAYRPSTTGNGYDFLIKNSWDTSWGDNGYAWSKQGCNKLASSAGDAAGFFYVEGSPDPGPGPSPDPQPAPAALQLPYEVVVGSGLEFALQPAHTKRGVRYEWSTGVNSYRLVMSTTASTTVTLKATDLVGNSTEQSVKVTVK
jgi:hypothetical protein